MAPKRRKITLGKSNTKRQHSSRNTNPQSVDNLVVTRTPVLADPSTPSLILSLPRELRDLIYHQIWSTRQPFELALPQKSDRHLAKSDYFIFTVHYSLQGTPTKPDRTQRSQGQSHIWWLANKQVCNEAIDQFQREATWTLTNDSGRPENVYHGTWRNPASRGRATRIGPVLLTPGGASNIHLGKCLVIHTLGEMDCSEKPIHRMTFQESDLLQRLGSGLAGTANLRRLELNLLLWSFPSDSTTPCLVNIELQLLQKLDLPNLQRLQFFIQYNKAFSSDQRLKSMFRNSLSEVSIALIGGSGTETCQVLHDLPALSNIIRDFDASITIYTFVRT
jgi:hypothetical protein